LREKRKQFSTFNKMGRVFRVIHLESSHDDTRFVCSSCF